VRKMVKEFFQRKLKIKRGQGLIEYAFLLTLVSLVLLIAIKMLGLQILDFFNEFTDNSVP